MRKIAIFPIKLFISILSNDKNIYFDKRLQFIYQIDNAISEEFIIFCEYICTSRLLAKNKNHIKTDLFLEKLT